MKKIYEKPVSESAELEVANRILAASGGGGIPAGTPSSAGATTPGFNVDPNW